MKLFISKLLLACTATLGCYLLARFLVIKPALPCGLLAWGAICFLFSREFSGEQMRVQQGIEQKPLLQYLWMGAGIFSTLLALGVLFYQM
jgi:hypothetical protein